MEYSKFMYLRYLFVTTFSVLAVIACANYFVDPAYVYRTVQNRSDTFAEALVKSENGLWWPDTFLPERAIKKSLADYADYSECVVVGSSHVMQIGSARTLNSLSDKCASIINLGVSGGTIEDHLALAYLSLHNKPSGKIVLGIDPWTFAYGKNTAWSYYSKDYQVARNMILGESTPVGAENTDTIRSKLINLLSLEYTVKSIRNLKIGDRLYYGKSAPKIDEEAGGKFPIFYRDGSLQYDDKFIAQTNKIKPSERIGLGGDYAYNTDGVLNERVAIDSYASLIRWIKSKGVEPILLLTPYHHNVWKRPFSANVRALMATEPIVRQLGRQLGVTVIGSYDPIAAGCSSDEFFDFMHAKGSCLAKLHELGSKEITNIGQAWLEFPVAQYSERARVAP